MSLSDKIILANKKQFYWVDDVKEFIRLLKEEIVKETNIRAGLNKFCDIIDKLAGEDLI